VSSLMRWRSSSTCVVAMALSLGAGLLTTQAN
jgi:hypothetical protein